MIAEQWVMFMSPSHSANLLYRFCTAVWRGQGDVAAWPAEWEQDVVQKQAASFELNIQQFFSLVYLSLTVVYNNNSIIVWPCSE